MRNGRFLWVIIVLAILLDLYIFQAVKTVSQGASARTRLILFSSYWALSLITITVFALLPYLFSHPGSKLRNYVFATLFGLFLAKIVAVVFFLADDLRRLFESALGLLSHSGKQERTTGEGISRSVFMSWLGLGIGGGLFSTLIYGFSNKYNYKIHRVRLSFDNLPPAFKGLKIVQLSDIHSGSFTNKKAVEKGVEMVLQQQADLILFTGDLVNDRATEMQDYMDVFGRLKAPMGIFSTLGNHDYGDYVWWESVEAKKANLDRLKQLQGEMGWRLLMNEHVVLEREGQQIALIGIENWSAKARFPKYGRMREACEGTEKYPFSILMSHDPSHWDAEVRPEYPGIDLALAGHTHGMQFGIDLPGIKWSPVQYVYKEWAGLYEAGRQKLYVNRGYGFIGYPGRVGVLPEITVIELV
jgi:predicted MPP superfamily phosphohydrolase